MGDAVTASVWLVLAAVTVVGTAGDVAMKLAGARPAVDLRWLVAGSLAYVATGLGWLWMLRCASLAWVGAVVPVCNTLFAVACGLAFFGERLSMRQGAGAALAVVAILLLSEAS